jgi:hypothetical protein
MAQVDLAYQVQGLLALGNGGTGASTAAAARTALGLGIGSNVEAWSANLDSWSAKTAPAGTVADLTSAQTLSDKTMSAPIITGYTETVQTSMGQVTAATHAIPALSTGTMAQAQLPTTGAVTFTMPTAVAGASFMMRLQQAATGLTATVTFTGVIWPNSVAYVPTAAASQYDLLSFFCFDGTHWDGSYQQSYSA